MRFEGIDTTSLGGVEYFTTYTRYGMCVAGPFDGRMYGEMADEFAVIEANGKKSYYRWDRKKVQWIWKMR